METIGSIGDLCNLEWYCSIIFNKLLSSRNFTHTLAINYTALMHAYMYRYLFSFYLPGRHSANVSKMHNSTSSSCSFAIAVRVAIIQAEALSLLVAPCPRIFIRSTGHVAARKTNRADHPRRRTLFCSSISSTEKSRWRRAFRIAARNICADISYCIAVPACHIKFDGIIVKDILHRNNCKCITPQIKFSSKLDRKSVV